jgi:signal transduction histidine kinase
LLTGPRNYTMREADKNKSIEERYRRAEETIRFKNEFTIRICHDLGNALNAIIIYLDLMYGDSGGVVSEEYRAYLKDMITCSEQLLKLIKALRSSANLDSCEKPIDINNLIGES